MVRDELSVMSAFLAVADERSFTKAAKRLGVTQSALSHAIRGLEEQRVVEDWCPPFPGFFLYYPSRRQQPAALTALIETLRV